MNRTKLKIRVGPEKYMSNTKRERHTREDNSNNISIKGPTSLLSASIVLLLLNMCISKNTI